MGELHSVGIVLAIDQRTILLYHIDGLGQWFQMRVGVFDAYIAGVRKYMTTKRQSDEVGILCVLHDFER